MPSLKPGYEIQPKNPVPPLFRPPDSVEHRVSDGEDWHSVAKRYNLPVEYLIFSNFKTNVPREINWYLREYIGCDLPTGDRKNWKFSTSARSGKGPRAGVVFIPLNWKAILAAAKKATRTLFEVWFQFASLGPAGTQVHGSMLTVLPGGLRSHVGKGWPVFMVFRSELRDAGAPDNLAESWASQLFAGLSFFTSTLHDIQAGLFPTLSGLGPFVGPAFANPWPLLNGKAVDIFLRWPQLRMIVQTSGIEGEAAEKAMREYALWLQSAFSMFRVTTIARDVQALVIGGDFAEGFATGHPGFLQGPGMVL